jgi:hypothetical protein
MGRSPFARNNTLWMSMVATLVGLLFTVLSFTHGGDPAGWNAFYENLVPKSDDAGNWNLLVQLLAIPTLIAGLWYLGEQILARRKFNRMMALEKKSEFQQQLPELKEEAAKLPQEYEQRLEEKMESFQSRR